MTEAKVKKLRVMFVIGSLRVGGAESQMVLLIQELVKQGVHCEVFAMKAEGDLLERLGDISVKVHDGAYVSSSNKLFFIWQTLRLISQLTLITLRRKINILHAYLPSANLIGGVAGRAARIPKIITSRRALGTHQDRSSLWKRLDKIANACSDIVTVNSMAVWEDVVKRDCLDEAKLRLIYNGLVTKPYILAKCQRQEARERLQLSKDNIAVGMVANLIAYKGHLDVIKAIPSVLDEFPKVIFLFAGEDRGIRTELECCAEALGVLGSIRFLGRCDIIPKFLAAMDIGLVASHEEGFCNALLEMMASSLPVVATKVGGNAEALQHGKLGILVPPKNSEALIQALTRLVASKEEREVLGKLAFKEVSDAYSVKAMVSHYTKLYGDL